MERTVARFAALLHIEQISRTLVYDLIKLFVLFFYVISLLKSNYFGINLK